MVHAHEDAPKHILLLYKSFQVHKSALVQLNKSAGPHAQKKEELEQYSSRD
jgi:hypothetical protein